MFKRILFLVLLGAPVSLWADNTDIQELLNRLVAIEQDQAWLAEVLEAGAERATLCVHCHGEDGNSKRNHIPNLASQNAEYLFTQFEHFANGERKDYVMSKLAQGLTSDDKIAVALYFSKSAVKVRNDSVASSPAGLQLYRSVCFACHGEKGYGDAQYPRIAGQPYEFLEKTLLRFQRNDDERKNSLMAGVVKNMTEQQLKDVAAYVANMQ